MKTYVNYPTISKGKIASTLWAKELALPIKRSGYCIYLVGCANGLKRHIKDKENLGFDQDSHVVVERDANTAISLIAEGVRLGFRGKVIWGDMLKTIAAYSKKGHIGHVDFDSVESYGDYSESIIDLCTSLSVNIVHVINSCRQNKRVIQQLANQYGFENIVKTGTKGKKIVGPPLSKHVLEHHLMNKHTSYYVRCNGYKGTGGNQMTMVVMLSRHEQ